MHEFSICRTLIRQVEQAAREHDARAVTAIIVSLGPLSGIHADELRQAFPLASTGSIAQSARLHIHYKPLQWRCQACGREHESAVDLERCANCGSDRLQLLSGGGVVLEHVEVTR
jgi:hydrogenase nickel incorporation protein HypA/HybF